MSHAATNWAIQQRGLKPATKVLLWHLADRHNKDTKRCDPSQALLAYDAEMSESTVNRHIDKLEELGLVRRLPRICPRTRKQLTTLYQLAFDHTFPVSQNDGRAVCQKTPEPSVKNGQSRLSKWETNPVREPVREPCAAAHDFEFRVFADRFVELFPRIGNLTETESILEKLIDGGADPEDILWGARCYGVEQKDNKRQYVAYSENWLGERRWEQHAKSDTEASDATIAANQADAIKACKSWVVTSISANRCRELVGKGLVTVAECKAAGIHL